MQDTSKVVVLGIVENNNNEFLISQRYEPQLSEVHLKWDLPGGTHELGECLENTLRREFLEETGLMVNVVSFLPLTLTKVWEYSDHKQYTLVLCFVCSLINGDIHLNDHKINDLKWISREHVQAFDFLPTTKQFIDLYFDAAALK